MIDWRSESTAQTVAHLRGVIDEVLPGPARVLLVGPDGRLWSAIDDHRPRPRGIDEGDAGSFDRTLPGDDPEPVADSLADDDRFPGLKRFRGLLEAGAGHLAAAERRRRRQAGVQLRQLAAFARQRPAAVLDRPDTEVGAAAAASRAARPAALTDVSEWAVDEVMIALGLSSRAAAGLLADAVTLDERLPATLHALEAGRINEHAARALAEIVGPVKDEARAEVEARLLARAGGKTVAQLREAARRAVLHADAAAAATRLARAIRDRSVRLQAGDDGMAALLAVMPLPVAQACVRALEAYAEDCKTPGDERTKDQRMVDCLADLILRPGINPPVQIGLTVVAGVDTLTGGDEPGELDGHPVPAVLIRELAHTLGLLPRPVTPDTEPATLTETQAETETGSDTAPDGGIEAEEGTDLDEVAEHDTESVPSTYVEPVPSPDAEPVPSPDAERCSEAEAAAGPGRNRSESAIARLGELLGLRRLAGTALTHLPTIAIVEEISGQLLALTDATRIRHTATCERKQCRTGTDPCGHPLRGPGLGPPPDTDGYSPSVPLATFVRARDRRCRFPGCRAAAIRCDLDHNTPWPGGTTSADNLCCLCRHHHRLSHQAPGWTMTRLPDGGLQWTTPGGGTLTTHPPRYGGDDDLPPPAATTEATATKPLTILEQLRRWPPPPPDPDDEPAPF